MSDEVGNASPESESEVEGAVLTLPSYEEEIAIARAVRMQVLKGTAIALPFVVGGGVLLGEEVLGNPVLLGIWLIALLAVVRAFVYPLDHTHLLRSPTPPQAVLAAGGLPEPEGAPALPIWDRRLAILDLIDELDRGRRGFWASRLGRFAGRWIAWIAASLWLVAGLVVGVVFGWAEASIGLFPALMFSAAGWFGERDRRNRTEAIELLQAELDALSLMPGGATPAAPAAPEAEPGQAGLDPSR